MHRSFIDTSIIMRILIEDDEGKKKDCENLIKKAKEEEVTLYVLPVAILETVWVLEKFYKYNRKKIREILGAILNTPDLHIEMKGVFRNALRVYEEKNVKFADAVMGYWGLERGLSTVFTYDEKDFKRIEGLEVRRP